MAAVAQHRNRFYSLDRKTGRGVACSEDLCQNLAPFGDVETESGVPECSTQNTA